MEALKERESSLTNARLNRAKKLYKAVEQMKQ